MAEVKPGSIIISHDGGGPRQETLAAYPTIIRDLRARGYRIVTIPELLGFRPIYEYCTRDCDGLGIPGSRLPRRRHRTRRPDRTRGGGASVTVDAWIQHPTSRFLGQEMFASLRRWTGGQIPDSEPPIAATVEAMDAAGVDIALLTAWYGPGVGALISNDEVAAWVDAHPGRFAGVAGVPLERPMDAVRELRRCVGELGFVALRLMPWLWEAAPTDRRYYPLYAACVELGVPFCTQVGHTGPLRPSETGRPIPYIDQVAIDFPELTIVCGHVGYPWTEEMVAVARKHENVYIDTSAYTIQRLPRELVDYMHTGSGARKVLFGSNWPMIAPAHALEGLDALALDDESRDLFLSANARRVFTLPGADT